MMTLDLSDLATVTGGAGVGARVGGAVGAGVGRAAGTVGGCLVGAGNGALSALAGPEEDGNWLQRTGATIANVARETAAGCVGGASFYGNAAAGKGHRQGAAVGNALTLGK